LEVSVEEYRWRASKIQSLLKEHGFDVVLMVNGENQIYFAGVSLPCLALLIPSGGEPAAVTLWLDTDYVQKKSGLKVYPYMFPTEKLGGKVVEVIRKFGFSKPKIGFERYFVDFSLYDSLVKNLPLLLHDASSLIYRVRSVKSEVEVGLLRRAAEIVDKGMEAAVGSVKPGVTELEVANEALYAMGKAGSGGPPFKPIVASGSRTRLSHPFASSKRIEKGEIVVVDIGATYQGYCGDMCRTVSLGASGKEIELYELLAEAQRHAVESIRSGTSCKEAYRFVRDKVDAKGYGKYFPGDVGYGIGLRQSEFYPVIGVNSEHVLEENMVVKLMTPSIYLPQTQCPRIEDMIHIRKDRAEYLTKFTREIIGV